VDVHAHPLAFDRALEPHERVLAAPDRLGLPAEELAPLLEWEARKAGEPVFLRSSFWLVVELLVDELAEEEHVQPEVVLGVADARREVQKRAAEEVALHVLRAAVVAAEDAARGGGVEPVLGEGRVVHQVVAGAGVVRDDAHGAALAGADGERERAPVAVVHALLLHPA
jgi:hypothetical protein